MSFRRKQVIESSKDEDLPRVQDIQCIWDDERAGHVQEDEEDMDDFIDYKGEEEAGGMDEQGREEKWRERGKKKGETM